MLQIFGGNELLSRASLPVWNGLYYVDICSLDIPISEDLGIAPSVNMLLSSSKLASCRPPECRTQNRLEPCALTLSGGYQLRGILQTMHELLAISDRS